MWYIINLYIWQMWMNIPELLCIGFPVHPVKIKFSNLQCCSVYSSVIQLLLGVMYAS